MGEYMFDFLDRVYSKYQKTMYNGTSLIFCMSKIKMFLITNQRMYHKKIINFIAR